MAGRVGATAVVTLTLEVGAFSSWRADCSVDQIHRQASKEVASAVEKFLREKRISVRIVGTPTVRTIITREDRP